MKRRHVMMSGAMCALAGLALLATPTTAPAAVVEKVIGQWDWDATTGNTDPLVNEANPGTYDAKAVNEATASGGLAHIVASGTTPYQNNDKFFDLGQITELDGARYFRMTFENVILSDFGQGDTQKTAVLAGSTVGGLSSNTSTFYLMMVYKPDGTTSYAQIALWGKDKNGTSIAYSTGATNVPYGSTLPISPGTAYDMEFVYESDGENATVQFRAREHGASWNDFVSKSTNIVQLNTLGGAQPHTLLGKYSASSSIIASETIGQTTLAVAVPEPSGMGVVGLSVLGLLGRRRAKGGR